MAKSKDTRVTITLECTGCNRNDRNEKLFGLSRYTTQKNRRNTPTQLELKKFCSFCHGHTIHKESKKMK